MLKFSEIFEFFWGKIPILKEFEWFEWFEWFGPSPIEPFNPGDDRSVDAMSHMSDEEAASSLRVYSTATWRMQPVSWPVDDASTVAN